MTYNLLRRLLVLEGLKRCHKKKKSYDISLLRDAHHSKNAIHEKLPVIHPSWAEFAKVNMQC
jgi:hypothetical protein